MICKFVSEPNSFVHILYIKKCEKLACLFDILFVASPIKKCKDPFDKVEFYCLFVPIGDNVQYKNIFILNFFAVWLLCNVQIWSTST